MFKQITLGKRIFSGTILMQVLIILVGLTGYMALNRVLQSMSLNQMVNSQQNTIRSIKELTDQYLLSGFLGQTEQGIQAINEIKRLLKVGTDQMKQIIAHPQLDENGLQLAGNAKKTLQEYGTVFNGYHTSETSKDELKTKILGVFDETKKEIAKDTLFSQQVTLDMQMLVNDFNALVNRPTSENGERITSSGEHFKQSAEVWADKVDTFDSLRSAGVKTVANHGVLMNAIQIYQETIEKQGDLRVLMNSNKANLVKIYQDLSNLSLVKLTSQTRMSNLFIISVVLISIILGLVVAFISVKTSVGKIKSVIKTIQHASSSVTQNAGEMTTACITLAEGASEQAASLEETSSSLVELSTRTKDNAEYAAEAKRIMELASNSVEKVDKHMHDMGHAIEDISESSLETGKIIKTIDEVAFQTNLLALNAAVEAARAGEAGAGFAVVADEVRNLAMRAAEAANSTSDLIENTIKSIQSGNDLTKATQSAFQENMDISQKVSDLIEKIASASNEQAQNFQQVGMAVSEMDKVVQNNAATAEESASAAEEMNSQALQLKIILNELGELTGEVKA